jgi:ElaB/YqjD/DUF883 family membrane-anchored ribosome-binding protein
MAVRQNQGPQAAPAVDATELARQIAELRADLARLTESLGDPALGRVNSLLDQLQARLAELAGVAEASLKDRMDGAEATLDGMADYARRQPLHALGLAAGAGMLLGLLMGRR